jgi:hypothetical protein
MVIISTSPVAHSIQAVSPASTLASCAKAGVATAATTMAAAPRATRDGLCIDM